VNVVQHKTAAEFLGGAEEWLERAEAENNLILGISKYSVTGEGRANVKPYFLTIEDSSILLDAAIMTRPRHLIISRMFDPALLAITDYFLKESITVPGLVGPKSTTQVFADYWKIKTGKSSRLKISHRIYAIYQGIGYEPVCDSDDLVFE
jgi:hypothetical protein